MQILIVKSVEIPKLKDSILKLSLFGFANSFDQSLIKSFLIDGLSTIIPAPKIDFMLSFPFSEKLLKPVISASISIVALP